MVSALDYEADDLGSISGSMNWLFSAGWKLNWVVLPAVSGLDWIIWEVIVTHRGL